MKWYNVYYENHNGCWHLAKNYAGTTNLDSLEEAQNCAKHIGQITAAKKILIKCITEEVVESFIIKSKEEALKEELVYLAELRECTKSLWNLYSSGPLKDSSKASYADLSLANINNSILEVNKKIAEIEKSKL
jgi:hypothetical protein